MEADIKQHAKTFLNENKHELGMLKQAIMELKNKDVQTLHEFRGNKTAIRIIENWIRDIWNLTIEELPEPQKEDDIFNIINN